MGEYIRKILLSAKLNLLHQFLQTLSKFWMEELILTLATWNKQ
jgi:hypothetical protein